jgi:hypothetical protein
VRRHQRAARAAADDDDSPDWGSGHSGPSRSRSGSLFGGNF